MRLLGDDVVFFAEADQFAKLSFKQFHLVAQNPHLPLDQRHGTCAVRVGKFHLGQQLGMVDDEIGMVMQIIGDIVSVHGSSAGPPQEGAAKMWSGQSPLTIVTPLLGKGDGGMAVIGSVPLEYQFRLQIP